MADTPSADASESTAALERGISEFGVLLGELVASTPEALGAVLSDGVDDTIDTARRPDEISELDLRITGAQVGQAMCKLNTSAIIFGLGRPEVVLEGKERVLISKVLFDRYLVTLVLQPQANIARAMRFFADAAEQLRGLLRA